MKLFSSVSSFPVIRRGPSSWLRSSCCSTRGGGGKIGRVLGGFAGSRYVEINLDVFGKLKRHRVDEDDVCGYISGFKTYVAHLHARRRGYSNKGSCLVANLSEGGNGAFGQSVFISRRNEAFDEFWLKKETGSRGLKSDCTVRMPARMGGFIYSSPPCHRQRQFSFTPHTPLFECSRQVASPYPHEGGCFAKKRISYRRRPSSVFSTFRASSDSCVLHTTPFTSVSSSSASSTSSSADTPTKSPSSTDAPPTSCSEPPRTSTPPLSSIDSPPKCPSSTDPPHTPLTSSTDAPPIEDETPSNLSSSSSSSTEEIRLNKLSVEILVDPLFGSSKVFSYDLTRLYRYYVTRFFLYSLCPNYFTASYIKQDIPDGGKQALIHFFKKLSEQDFDSLRGTVDELLLRRVKSLYSVVEKYNYKLKTELIDVQRVSLYRLNIILGARRGSSLAHNSKEIILFAGNNFILPSDSGIPSQLLAYSSSAGSACPSFCPILNPVILRDSLANDVRKDVQNSQPLEEKLPSASIDTHTETSKTPNHSVNSAKASLGLRDEELVSGASDAYTAEIPPQSVGRATRPSGGRDPSSPIHQKEAPLDANSPEVESANSPGGGNTHTHGDSGTMKEKYPSKKGNEERKFRAIRDRVVAMKVGGCVTADLLLDITQKVALCDEKGELIKGSESTKPALHHLKLELPLEPHPRFLNDETSIQFNPTSWKIVDLNGMMDGNYPICLNSFKNVLKLKIVSPEAGNIF